MRCEDPPTHTHPPLSQKFPEEVPGNPSPRKEEKGGGEGKKMNLMRKMVLQEGRGESLRCRKMGLWYWVRREKREAWDLWGPVIFPP